MELEGRPPRLQKKLELEDELTAITAHGHGGCSPDRADAMVWALTELVLRAPAEPRVRAM